MTTQEHLQEAERLLQIVKGIVAGEMHCPDANTFGHLKTARDTLYEVSRHVELATSHEQRAPMYRQGRSEP